MSEIKEKTAVWRLKGGEDRRFRAGHPWVYSNELAASPKGLEPGAPVELCDAGGKFLARGYGNPASLIAFRALTRDPEITEPFSSENLAAALVSAGRLRETLGLAELSYRLCFGEADGLPGLIIDRYRLAPDREGAQAFVVQAHTAGMNRIVPRLVELLQVYVEKAQKADPVKWERTAIVLRNDVGVRKLEGMEEEEPRVLREVKGLVLTEAKIRVASAAGKAPMEFTVDLVAGQKTGFFLDQVANIQLAAQRLGRLRPAGSGPLRILDLCCYAGQWGSQLARVFKEQGISVQVTAVDASARALELARANVSAQGASVEALRADVLKDLADLPEKKFDLVISDPPALIRGRKDLPQGTHAYLQLNTQVFRLVRPGGGVVSCSCSGLLDEEDFLRTLAKAAGRRSRRVRWVARGGASPDHPALAEFPEGRYLKCWIGVVDG